MGVKQLTNEELIDAYAYNNWLYSVNGKNFDILQENYKELLHRMEQSPIVKAMKDEENSDIRLSHSGNWMYWDDSGNQWVVRTSTRYGRKTTVLIETTSESEAITALLAD
jgi:hypothetical protein